jgi:hypothetical protein
MEDPTAPLTEPISEAKQSVDNRRSDGTFGPNNVANPHGRPKKTWTMTDLIEDSLNEADETGEPYKKIIARKLRSIAVRGDLQAIKEVIDRMDGKAKESVDVNAQGGFTVVLKREP